MLIISRSVFVIQNVFCEPLESSIDIQGEQLKMAVFFWYIVKSNLSSVRYCNRVNCTSQFLQGTRKTRPC